MTALNALFGRLHAFATPDLSYPAATAAHQDEDLPLPEDGHGRLVAWVVPDADTENWARAQPRRLRAAACTATAIVDLLGRTMGAGATRVNPSHVAVLTRTNREARLVHEALRARRVPSVVRDDGDVMQSDTASDLAAILKAVLSPTHPGWRRAAMATRLFGYDSAMLAALTTADADRWLNNFSTWNDLWHRHGNRRADGSSGSRFRPPTLRLARAPTGARHLTDLRHLVELLQAREAEGQHAPIKLLQWFEGERMSESSSADERLHRLEEDGDAVQIVTVHRAKGLEFDFLYCPYLWSVMPDARVTDRLLVRRNHGWVLADGTQRDNRTEHRASTAERLREDVRLAYVALTRARRRVTLLAGPLGYTARATLPPTALDWLLRADEQVDSLEDWYKNVTDRKTDAAACKHDITLRRLRAAYPDVLTVLPPPSPTETVWTTRGRGATAMQARPVPVLDLHAWHLTSFSQLAQGRHDERDHRDAVVEPDDAVAIGAVADAMDADVPLATLLAGPTPAIACTRSWSNGTSTRTRRYWWTAAYDDTGSIPPRLPMRCGAHSPR